MEIYILDNGRRIKEMVTDIKGGQMETHILESMKIICNVERVFNRIKAYFSKSSMIKVTLLTSRN
jgi:hypothetical protein